VAVFVSERVETDQIDHARDFVKRLRLLSREDLVLLRRNAGKTIDESRGVAKLHRLLVEEISEHDEVHFLLATLFALNRLEFQGNFGRSMSSLGGRIGRDEVEHRFRALLDSEFYTSDGLWITGGGLSLHLRQLVRLAETNRVGIDWVQLLVDLCDWDDRYRRVQKEWAESFYAPRARNASAESLIDGKGRA